MEGVEEEEKYKVWDKVEKKYNDVEENKGDEENGNG